MTDLLPSYTSTLARQGESAPIVPGMPGASPANGMQQVPGASPGAGAEPTGGFGGGIFWIVILMFVVLMLMTTMSGRKQRKERDKLVAGAKRNDRVQTVGGIIGTIIELTDNEMVLRVDETSNTRIRFARSAIQQVLREGKESGKIETRTEPSA
jgi:preprotein translocase subunit YajC